MPDAFIPVYDDDLGQVVLDGLPAGAAGGAGLRPAAGLELVFDRADGHLAQAIIDPGEAGVPTECPGGLAALFGPGTPEAIRAAVTGRGPVRALSPDPGLLAAWSRLARLDEARVTSPVPSASVLWAAEAAMTAGRGGLRPRARAEARSAVAGLAELLEPGPVPDGLSRAARAVADLAEADEPRAARRLRHILGQAPAAPAERWLADRASVPERHADRERQWECQCPGDGWVVIPHLQWSLDPRLIPGRVLVPGLSPAIQSGGKAARSLFRPGLQAIIQPSSCSRDLGLRTLPKRILLADPVIARGVVVSSKPLYSLDSSSYRSERVMLSPRLRTNCVRPAGPPALFINRTAAVLSLTSRMA